LWLFDSGGNNSKIRYDPFPLEAIREFEKLSLSSDSSVLQPSRHALMYFHIPFPEFANLNEIVGYQGLFDAALASGQVPFPFNYVPGLVKMLSLHRVAGSSTINNNLFDTIVRTNASKNSQSKDDAFSNINGGNVLAAFCGHCHHNDFIGIRSGVFLGYGRVSSYTPPRDFEGKAPLPFKSGGRIVDYYINQDKLNTYIVNDIGVENDSFLWLDKVLYRSFDSHNTSKSRTVCKNMFPPLLLLFIATIIFGYFDLFS
jgi:hypothetical protein